MKINLMPISSLGKWSFWLFIALLLFFVVFQILDLSGQSGGETFLDNLFISVPMFIASASGILAFFTGIIAIIKKKERSIFVYISTLVGLFVLWFIIGEILLPHQKIK